MKIQCPKCQKTYRLPADRVPAGGGSFKVRCKQCGTVMDIVSPDQPEQSASDIKPAPPQQSSSDIRVTGDVKWFVAAGGERQGPFSTAEVEARIKSGEFGPDTYAWHKGFKGWEKLGEIEPFKTMFPDTSFEGETQMMNISEVAKLSAAAPSEHPATETESKEQMVWTRRETSVLFSLDDYKSRRKAGTQPAMESLVQVKPIESPVAQKPPTQKVSVISLDEAEIKRVAEELARRKRQRKIIAIAASFVLGVAIVAGAVAYFMTMLPAPEPTPTAAPPAPMAVNQVRPQPEPQPQVQQTPAPVQALETTPEKVTKPTTQKLTAKKAEQKTAEQKPAEQKPKESTAPVPQPVAAKPKDEAEDVNTMLANFRKGQAATPEKQGGQGAATASDENLPEQLSTGVINSVMRKKQTAVEACVRNAGSPAGTTVRAVARLTISGSGQVTAVSVGNAGEATVCIENALRGLTFPKFKAENQTVVYPYIVQM